MSQEELEVIASTLSNMSLDWKTRESALTRLASIVKEGQEVDKRLGGLVGGQFGDLRSGIVKAAREVVETVANTVFAPEFALGLLSDSSIVKAIGSGNSVIAGHASTAFLALFSAGVVDYWVLPILLDASTSKSALVRERVAQAAKTFVENSKNESKKISEAPEKSEELSKLMAIVESLSHDSSPGVRTAAKSARFTLDKLFECEVESKTVSLLSTLDEEVINRPQEATIGETSSEQTDCEKTDKTKVGTFKNEEKIQDPLSEEIATDSSLFKTAPVKSFAGKEQGTPVPPMALSARLNRVGRPPVKSSKNLIPETQSSTPLSKISSLADLEVGLGALEAAKTAPARAGLRKNLAEADLPKLGPQVLKMLSSRNAPNKTLLQFLVTSALNAFPLSAFYDLCLEKQEVDLSDLLFLKEKLNSCRAQDLSNPQVESRTKLLMEVLERILHDSKDSSLKLASSDCLRSFTEINDSPRKEEGESAPWIDIKRGKIDGERPLKPCKLIPEETEKLHSTIETLQTFDKSEPLDASELEKVFDVLSLIMKEGKSESSMNDLVNKLRGQLSQQKQEELDSMKGL